MIEIQANTMNIFGPSVTGRSIAGEEVDIPPQQITYVPDILLCAISYTFDGN